MINQTYAWVYTTSYYLHLWQAQVETNTPIKTNFHTTKKLCQLYLNDWQLKYQDTIIVKKFHPQQTTQVETEKWDKEYALDLVNNPLTLLQLYLATGTN